MCTEYFLFETGCSSLACSPQGPACWTFQPHQSTSANPCTNTTVKGTAIAGPYTQYSMCACVHVYTCVFTCVCGCCVYMCVVDVYMLACTYMCSLCTCVYISKSWLCMALPPSAVWLARFQGQRWPVWGLLGHSCAVNEKWTRPLGLLQVL